MILFWGLIIAGIVALVRYIGGSRKTEGPWVQGPQRPEDMLAERLARGEIDVDEYKRRLELLQGRR
ncbi:SHOCT domain-containing protein [Nonomuraea cavernae]|uniref:SHOCT domain-containing protein n=1 Tax=Nonomuraea cavernae TaxID=2045107 RepID=UPI0033D54806